MKIAKLELTHFRNFPQLELKFSPGLNLLIGNNAQGKTNLLEAIHYLSTTRSFRGSRDSDLLGFGQEFARISTDDVEVLLQPGEKKIKLHGKETRAAEVLGVLRSVLFSPEDMTLLQGTPQGRRAFLDELISRIDRKYLLTLISYHKTLKQRNRLLWLVREHGKNQDELSSWDELLISDGSQILARRLEVVKKIQLELDQISPGLFSGQKIELSYQTKITGEQPTVGSIKEAFGRGLAKTREAEIKSATSLLGPHRDDFEVTLQARDLGRFGSRGEQRAAILALKLAEVKLNELEKGERPILLLDDVLSEFDNDHQRRLLAEVGRQQTILSTTSTESLPKEILAQAEIFEVKAGQVAGNGVEVSRAV